MSKKKNEVEVERLKPSIDKDKFELRTQKLNLLADGLSEETLNSEAKIFKAPSDVNRLKIVQLLKERELCACELTLALSNSQSTVSHRLSVLKNAGLIKEKKEGKWSYFRLSEGAIIELLKQVKLLVDK